MCGYMWVCIQNRKVQNSLRSVGNCFASRSNFLLRCVRKMVKCDDDAIGRNTASMHRGFRPEESFLCCMRAMTSSILYYLRSLKYKEGNKYFSCCARALHVSCRERAFVYFSRALILFTVLRARFC
jgi:hypothetical protein